MTRKVYTYKDTPHPYRPDLRNEPPNYADLFLRHTEGVEGKTIRIEISVIEEAEDGTDQAASRSA